MTMQLVSDSDAPKHLAALAQQVRSRLGHITTKGQCREVCLATALMATALDHPVCVCYGHIHINDEQHGHWWLRHLNVIIDPTFDQYGSTDVLITSETDATWARYVAKHWFCVWATRLQQLAGLVPSAC